MSDKIRDFMVDIAENYIVKGKKYSVRIEIKDGGINSYIGLCVSVEDFHRKIPVISGISLFRHTNSVENLENTWKFNLGDICNPYTDNISIPLEFSSYGKTQSECMAEAEKYFEKIKRIVRKQTAEYNLRETENEEAEKEALIKRLKELGVNQIEI